MKRLARWAIPMWIRPIWIGWCTKGWPLHSVTLRRRRARRRGLVSLPATSPHNSGVQRNNDTWPRLWVRDLRAAGYYCVNVGKMHADPYSDMHGFHERFVVENKQRRLAEPLWSGNPHVFDDEWDKALAARGFARPEKPEYLAWPDAQERQGCFEWTLPEELHPDNFIGDLALRWIDKAPAAMDEAALSTDWLPRSPSALRSD